MMKQEYESAFMLWDIENFLISCFYCISREAKMSAIGWHITSEVFVRIFRYTGNWFPTTISYLYSIYAFVIYTMFVLLYAVFTIMYLLSVKSVNDATQALFMIAIVFQVFTKATCLLLFNSRIRNLLHRFHNDFELHNDIERNFINTKLRSFLNLLVPYLILCATCVSLASIGSIFKINRELPLPTWYPLNWANDKLSYWIAWVHISLATYVAIGSTPAVQMFSSYLMFFISLLMNVLGQRLSNLWRNQDANTKTDDFNDLIKCIQMHQKILELDA